MSEEIIVLKSELQQKIFHTREYAANIAEKRRNEALAVFGLISLFIALAAFFSIDHIVSLEVQQRIGDETVDEMTRNATTISDLKNKAIVDSNIIKNIKPEIEFYDCVTTDYLNGYDKKFDFRCPENAVIVGMYSKHLNKHEDRRFKLTYCKIRIKSN